MADIIRQLTSLSHHTSSNAPQAHENLAEHYYDIIRCVAEQVKKANSGNIQSLHRFYSVLEDYTLCL